MNPTEPNVPAIRQRRPMTEARLKANRENAKKAALSGRSGRPRGSMDGNRLSLRERCRVRDEEHVATLERIAADVQPSWLPAGGDTRLDGPRLGSSITDGRGHRTRRHDTI